MVGEGSESGEGGDGVIAAMIVRLLRLVVLSHFLRFPKLTRVKSTDTKTNGRSCQ